MNLSSQIAIRRYRRADDGTAVRMLSFLPTLYPNGMLWLQKRLDDVVDGKAQCRLASFLSAPAGIAIETPKSCSSGSATVDCRLSTSPLTPIIPVYPERILRRALNENPGAHLTPTIPARTNQIAVSPIIPALTQNKGGGGPLLLNLERKTFNYGLAVSTAALCAPLARETGTRHHIAFRPVCRRSMWVDSAIVERLSGHWEEGLRNRGLASRFPRGRLRRPWQPRGRYRRSGFGLMQSADPRATSVRRRPLSCCRG